MTTESERPNFLIFMVDEERYPPVYENDALKAWRLRYLKAQDVLRETGVEFRRHYAASTACCPSRSSIFTGQYPSLHGVTQTPGAAKQSYDPGMFWLDPNTVPTLGDYFRAAGYRTFYQGKWHVSDADIILPGTHDPLLTWAVGDDNNPVPIPRNIEVYRQADLLGAHGGMHQKWHCASEESIHVPLIISNPGHVKEPRSVETLSSHVDLIPTLLALAGADQREVQEIAARDHCEVRPLVGRDLSAFVRGDGASVTNEPIYYMSDDEVSEGQSQFNPVTKKFYHSVVQPNHVETVIAVLEGKAGRRRSGSIRATSTTRTSGRTPACAT